MSLKSVTFVFASSYGFAIFIVTIWFLPLVYAEYDCSAKDDGWYYDPEFCHIYWRCIHGSSEEFECASGTAWDHHENRCNWLDSVDCSRAEKSNSKVSAYDDEEENENQDENEDAPPVTAAVKTKKKRKKNQKLNSNKRMLDGENNEENDDKELILQLIELVRSSSDFLCAGREGFFADPEYCTRYYRCSHGNDEVFECPRGTAWDETTSSCSWVDQVNCEQKKLGYSTTTPSEDGTTLNKKADGDSNPSDTNSATAVSPINNNGVTNGAPIECQPTGIYIVPDPNECNAYYQCDKGTRTRLNCPDRKLFDIDKRECNDYERVTCGSRAMSLADKNQCVGKRDGIHPDVERDCHFYYQCISQNKMREAKCPGDQKFSSYTGRCGSASFAPAPCGSYAAGNGASRKGFASMSFFFLSTLVAVFLHRQ